MIGDLLAHDSLLFRDRTRWLVAPVLTGLIDVGWLFFILDMVVTRGVFDWLGIDFGFFFAGARAFIASLSAIHDLSMLAVHLEPFGAYLWPQAEPQEIGPIP